MTLNLQEDGIVLSKDGIRLCKDGFGSCHLLNQGSIGSNKRSRCSCESAE